MQITRTSILSGVTRTRELPVTTEELERWSGGELVQNVWPELSADDREFIISGCVPSEWAEHVGGCEVGDEL